MAQRHMHTSMSPLDAPRRTRTRCPQCTACSHRAGAQQDPAAFEKLVIRHIPRPSSRTIAVGDVVAFSSPLDPANEHSVMVRRVRCALWAVVGGGGASVLGRRGKGQWRVAMPGTEARRWQAGRATC
jgi:hypothetical protein